MPQKRPPDTGEGGSYPPPPKNPALQRLNEPDSMMSDLRTLPSRNDQPTEALIQAMIKMMNGFENTIAELNNTIKELREEIKILKERSSVHSKVPQPPVIPYPARPNAWVNPYPKHPLSSTPKQPPKNIDVNNFKAATLIIHKTPGTEPFKGLKNSDIVQKINKALSSIKASVNGSQVQIRSASILKSGDVLMHMDNRFIKKWLLEHKHVWTKLAHDEFITSQTRYPILFNYVPADLEIESEDFPKKLSEQNGIPLESIHSVKWLKNPNDTQKNHGTIVLNLLDKDLARRIGKGGLYADYTRIRSREYVQGPTMCFNCLDLYHTHNACNNYAYCAKCGDPHNTKDCANNDSNQVCARCFHFDCLKTSDVIDRFSPKYAHSPKSLGCPLRNTKFTITPQHTIDDE